MKTTSLFFLAALSVAQTHAYNLPQHPTRQYKCEDCTKLSHDRLKTNWNITEMPLDHQLNTNHKSYSYNQRVTAEELRRGVALSTRAPGAVVRITPLERKSMPELDLKTPQNQLMALKDASALYAQDETLRDAFMGADHQTMMQLKPELGFGTFIIKSKSSVTNEAPAYLINVFDKFSLIYLQVEPEAMQYKYGDHFAATISLKDSDNSYSVDEVNAHLINTDDQTIPLKLTEIKRNKFLASTDLLSELNAHGDNWYIEAEVLSEKDDGFVRRSARTAFSYSIPSASLLSIKKVSSHPLTFAATIDVATTSRYALQGVLFHKKASGEVVPIETSQSAQWLDTGKQTIQFNFDNSNQIAEDALFVGYLHLTDYGQLKTVYQHNQPIKLSQLMD